jgi:hypothetical protein
MQVNGNMKIDSTLLVKDTLKVEGDIEASQDLKVDGDVYVNGKVVVNELWTPRIRSPYADKTIYIGDSTVSINYGYNFISNTSGSYMFNGVLVRGLSIGPTTNGSVTSVATGSGSLSLGNFIQTHGTGAITAGKGLNASSPFKNNDDFTFKVGFNSDIATFTVTPSAGAGTTGNVGIGTESPDAKLTVAVDATPAGGYGILSYSNEPTVKSISVIHKDPGQQIDQENFIVFTDGRVYCREIFVKLGVLGDFVFDDDYQLMSYSKLAEYLKQNHHLPGVPSETEVLNGGMNVGEMQAKVLQKTEENTLYILDLNSRLEEKEKENEFLKSELKELKKKQQELEEKLNEMLNKK